MRFRIALHSGFNAPADAIETLAERLGPSRESARFKVVGNEIVASWGEDAPVAMERDEQEEVGRLTLLELIEAICEDDPSPKYDWFAVAPRPN